MENRCIFCMEELNRDEEKCPACGKIRWEYAWEKTALVPGTVLKEQYLLGAVLGNGGFGITYIGFDTVLKQKVAVKELYPQKWVTRAGDAKTVVCGESFSESFEKAKRTFKDEAALIFGSFDLPGICSVKDYFEENGTAYIVEEYLPGGSLKEALGKCPEHTMDWEECRAVFAPALEGLAYLHSMGIVHCDISPDNLMFDENGSMKLIDFGAARQLMHGDAPGAFKEEYAAPEQFTDGRCIGPWSDIYSICAVMYQVLTGRKLPPVHKRMRSAEPVSLSRFVQIAGTVENAIGQGLEPDMQKRYFCAGRLMEQLGMDASRVEVLTGKTRNLWGELWLKLVTEEESLYQKRKRRWLTARQKKRILIGLASVCSACALLAAGLFFYAKTHPVQTFEYKLEWAKRKAQNEKPEVISRDTRRYQTVTAALQDTADANEGGEYQKYDVVPEFLKRYGLSTNVLPKFYLDKALAKELTEYYLGGELQLEKISYNTAVTVRHDFPLEIVAFAKETYRYNEQADSGMYVDITYDVLDKRVIAVEMVDRREQITAFLKSVFPYIVPEAYLTEAEIEGLLAGTESGDPSVLNHAKYALLLSECGWESDLLRLNLMTVFSAELMFV